MKLLLSPHNDDETLFAAYTCMREKPHVAICLFPLVQQTRHRIEAKTRCKESYAAINELGCEGRQLMLASDIDPSRKALKRSLEALKEEGFDQVWAPALEEGGHEQHNLVAEVALELWPDLTAYMTYRRGEKRSRGSIELEPTPEEIACKQRAMACYLSQMTLPDTAPWFSDEWEWQREWLA